MRKLPLRASAIALGLAASGLTGAWTNPADAAHGSMIGSGWSKCAYDPGHNCGVAPVDKSQDGSADTTGTIPAPRRHHAAH